MRWSEEQLATHLAKTGVPAPRPRADNPAFALGRLKTGEMNKTEAAYDQHLWRLRSADEILRHKFEGIKLRLAANTFLTICFPVMRADSLLEMHEVKGGWWTDDGRVKIKVAASLYPFRFIGVQKAKDGWEVEESFDGGPLVRERTVSSARTKRRPRFSGGGRPGRRRPPRRAPGVPRSPGTRQLRPPKIEQPRFDPAQGGHSWSQIRERLEMACYCFAAKAGGDGANVHCAGKSAPANRGGQSH